MTDTFKELERQHKAVKEAQAEIRTLKEEARLDNEDDKRLREENARLRAEIASWRERAIAAAIKVGTEYAYDHEHLGPDATRLSKRLEKMARKALEEDK